MITSGVRPELQDGVGAAVDADEQRPLLLQVAAAAQQLEVLLVVDAPDDHEHLPALEVDRDVGDVRIVDEQVALALDVVEGVLGEALELVAHVAAGVVEHGAERGRCPAGCPWRWRWSPTRTVVAVDGDGVAVGDRGHDVVADAVEDGDAGGRRAAAGPGWGTGRRCSRRR